MGLPATFGFIAMEAADRQTKGPTDPAGRFCADVKRNLEAIISQINHAVGTQEEKNEAARLAIMMALSDIRDMSAEIRRASP